MPDFRPTYNPVSTIEEGSYHHPEFEASNSKIIFAQRYMRALTIILFVSISLNVAFGAYWILDRNGSPSAYQAAIPAPRIPIIYDSYHKGFDDDDIALSDSYWSGLFPDGNGVVSLSDEIVNAENLPPSIRAPEENGRSLYIMAGYHSLHCLTHIRYVVRNYYFAQYSDQEYTMGNGTWGHTKHCLGDLRQSLLCNLDQTLLAQPDQSHDPGDGQVLQCKSLSAINEWLVSHRHFADNGDLTEKLDSTAI